MQHDYDIENFLDCILAIEQKLYYQQQYIDMLKKNNCNYQQALYTIECIKQSEKTVITFLKRNKLLYSVKQAFISRINNNDSLLSNNDIKEIYKLTSNILSTSNDNKIKIIQKKKEKIS